MGSHQTWGVWVGVGGGEREERENKKSIYNIIKITNKNKNKIIYKIIKTKN